MESHKMWDDRARHRGRLAVGHIAWTEAQFDAETLRMVRKLDNVAELIELPPLHETPPLPSREMALDFGCGVGRFVSWIVRRGYAYVGVDASYEMRSLAFEHAEDLKRLVDGFERVGTAFLPLVDGHIPVATGDVDFFFSCTVLQHIPDLEIDHIASELRRVMRPGTKMLLVENTDKPAVRRTSKSGHVVFRDWGEYIDLFPGLELLDSMTIQGEVHTIFGGTYNP